MRFILLLFWVSCFTFSLAECRSQTQEAGTTEQAHRHRKKHHGRHKSQDFRRHDSTSSVKGVPQDESNRTAAGSTQIPKKVYDVLAYVRANGHAMAGYVGGRRIGNFENHLPRSSTDGKPIAYQEWDVNPKIAGQNRGTERLITGSDNRAWYTNDHYNTFTEVK